MHPVAVPKILRPQNIPPPHFLTPDDLCPTRCAPHSSGVGARIFPAGRRKGDFWDGQHGQKRRARARIRFRGEGQPSTGGPASATSGSRARHQAPIALRFPGVSPADASVCQAREMAAIKRFPWAYPKTANHKAVSDRGQSAQTRARYRCARRARSPQQVALRSLSALALA